MIDQNCKGNKIDSTEYNQTQVGYEKKWSYYVFEKVAYGLSFAFPFYSVSLSPICHFE